MAAAPVDESRPVYQQFMKLATNKVVLDLSYTLLPGKEKNPEYPSLPEAKVVFTLVDYTKKPSLQLRHHMDARIFRVLAWDILLGRFPEAWPSRNDDGKEAGWGKYVEYKGTAQSTSQKGKPEARRLTILFNPDPDRKYPWTIKIERGLGEIIGRGAVNMKQVQDTVQFPLATLPMRAVAADGLEFLSAQRAFRVSSDSMALL